MNKILILICSIVLVSSAVMADEAVETCANGAGTIKIGKVTDHKYCMSNHNMNWWNAYAWCDALGRRLIRLEDCGCDGTRNCSSSYPGLVGVCPETNGMLPHVHYVWTMNPGYNITLSSPAYIRPTPDRNYMDTFSGAALCY